MEEGDTKKNIYVYICGILLVLYRKVQDIHVNWEYGKIEELTKQTRTNIVTAKLENGGFYQRISRRFNKSAKKRMIFVFIFDGVEWHEFEAVSYRDE